MNVTASVITNLLYLIMIVQSTPHITNCWGPRKKFVIRELTVIVTVIVNVSAYVPPG